MTLHTTPRTYDIGDLVTATTTFTVDGVATDPTTVTFTYAKPDGTNVVLLYGTDVALVRDSVGHYHVDLLADAEGGWAYRWHGSGNLTATYDTNFTVLPLLNTGRFAEVPLLAAYLVDDDLQPGDLMATAALEAATAAIQSYCDQTLLYVENDTVLVDGSGSDILLLPEYPVLDVSNVIDDFDGVNPQTLVGPGNGTASEYGWNEAGLLIRRRGNFILYENRFEATFGMWTRRRNGVQVTYSHGYKSIPSDLKLVCVAAAARGIAQDGANSETIGSYTAQYAGQPATFTDGEKRILDRYRARRH